MKKTTRTTKKKPAAKATKKTARKRTTTVKETPTTMTPDLKKYRQGDVLILGIPEIPADAKPVKREGRLVLAHGTSTGHSHAIDELHVEAFDREGRMYLRFTEVAHLVHEEHTVLELAPGSYEVRRQREHEPQASRVVMD